MKKMIQGITWQTLGFFGAIAILCIAGTLNWDYNGITGLAGSLLGTKLIIPLAVCALLFIAGAVMSFSDIKKDNR